MVYKNQSDMHQQEAVNNYSAAYWEALLRSAEVWHALSGISQFCLYAHRLSANRTHSVFAFAAVAYEIALACMFTTRCLEDVARVVGCNFVKS